MRKLLFSLLLLLPLSVVAQELIREGGYKFSITRGADVQVEALHREDLTCIRATATGRGSDGTTTYNTNISADKGIAVSGINLTGGKNTTYTVTVTGIPAGTEIKRITIGTNAMASGGGEQSNGESRTRLVKIEATKGGNKTVVVNNVNTEFNNSTAADGVHAHSYEWPLAHNTYTLSTPIVADGGNLVFDVTFIGCAAGLDQTDAATKGVFVTFKNLTLGIDHTYTLNGDYVQKYNTLTGVLGKMVAPGDFVKAEGNYYVTADQKAIVENAIDYPTLDNIDAAYAIYQDCLTTGEQNGIVGDNLYVLNNNTNLESGVIYVGDESKLKGTTSAVTVDNMPDTHKWMIRRTDDMPANTYMLYNIGANGVANCTTKTASTANAWEALSTFFIANQGYVVIERKNDAQWRIRDSQVEFSGTNTADNTSCYMNNSGSDDVTIYQQDGTPNGNPNSLFNLCYLGKATQANISAADDMMQAIDDATNYYTRLVDVYRVMVAQGESVPHEQCYFVTREDKTTVGTYVNNAATATDTEFTTATNEQFTAAKTVVDALPELQNPINGNNIYCIARSNGTDENTITYLLRTNDNNNGLTATSPTSAANYPLNLWYKYYWVLSPRSNTEDEYMMYNVDSHSVMQRLEGDNWGLLSEFDTFDQGYMKIEQIEEGNIRWKLSDTENTTSYEYKYLHFDGSIKVWYARKGSNDAGSKWYIRYVRPITDMEGLSESVNAMMTRIENPTGQVVEVTVSDVKLATMYYGTRNMIVPEGVKGYTFTGNADAITAHHTYTKGDVIPAGTGVLLRAERGTYSFELSPERVAANENLLVGTDVDTAIDDVTGVYVLRANGDGGAGFYKASTGFNNAAHKAYLRVAPGADGNTNVRYFSFADLFNDTATAIEDACGATQQGISYDLSGRRIAQPTRGLYIQNGNKYIVR